ncbi:glycosyl hydrolase [Micromonosporaceae bacterium Da 78-11]
MSRPRRYRLLRIAAVPTAFALSVVTTLAWAWTGGVQQIGPPVGSVGDPTVTVPAPDFPATRLGFEMPGSTPSTTSPTRTSRRPEATAAAQAAAAAARTGAKPLPGLLVPGAAVPRQSGSDAAPSRRGSCRTGAKLVPTCGILWGVAPGAHTESRGPAALRAFERKTGRHQAIYHAYHGGVRQLFPTPEEISIARQKGAPRVLFLNWKPESASWAAIARGDKRTDAYLDRLAAHIKKTYPEQFFFAVHHEGENDVRERPGSGYTARDYAAMYRHVINRLRAHGVRNMVSVLVHMAYVPHAQQSWFDRMYPGDDVVDWIGLDVYAYSKPGYGHGDFAEVLNRKLSGKRSWPGFYNWAVSRHAGKPLMIAEWGVWSYRGNAQYKVDFYRQLGAELKRFPKIRAMVQFETPHNQKGQDSSVDSTKAALQAYRNLGRLPMFQVDVTPKTR